MIKMFGVINNFRDWKTLFGLQGSMALERPTAYELTGFRSVDDVQREYLDELVSIQAALGVKFILIDHFSEPRIRFLALNTAPDFIIKFLSELASRGFSVMLMRKEKVLANCSAKSALRSALRTDLAVADRIDFFKVYSAGGVLIHGPWSAISVQISSPAASGQEITIPNYSFVQTSLRRDRLDRLPTVRLLGHELPCVPNLARIVATGVIPEYIDVVYTWVDGSDPAWADKKDRILGSGHGSVATTVDASAPSRFRNRDELMFSLRSALTYVKGLRKVFIVTDQQIPAFWARETDRVSIIDHRQIFKCLSNLPTFNSHAIESQLHNISGLADKYLYLNDDFLFGRAVTPFLFFDEYGRSRCFYSRSVTIPDGPVHDDDRGVDVAAKNAREIIRDLFGVPPSRKFKHTPVPIIRDVVRQMEDRLPDVFLATASHRFRSPSDVCVSGSLYYHYASAIGRAVEGQIRYDYININGGHFSRKIKRILAETDAERLDTFCINDVDSEGVDNEADFASAMQALFPFPCEVEVS